LPAGPGLDSGEPLAAAREVDPHSLALGGVHRCGEDAARVVAASGLERLDTAQLQPQQALSPMPANPSCAQKPLRRMRDAVATPASTASRVAPNARRRSARRAASPCRRSV
jgi:hypothetical protein